MKKIISLLTAILISLCVSTVYATISFNATLEANKTTIKAGNEVELKLKLDNFTENENGINVLLGTLEYDKSIFETVTSENITSLQYWDIAINEANGRILLDANEFVTTPHDAISIKLKVKDSVTEAQSTTVKFTNIEASDSYQDINPSDTEITLNLEAKANINNNIIYIVIIVLAVIVVASIIIVVVKRKKSDKDDKDVKDIKDIENQ